MKIKTLLQTSKCVVPCFHVQTDVVDALNELLTYDAFEAPVLGQNEIMGLVRRSALSKTIMFGGTNFDSLEYFVNPDFVSAHTDDDVEDILKRLTDKTQTIIPVTSEGMYISSVSKEDLLKECLNRKLDLLKQYEAYIRGFGLV